LKERVVDSRYDPIAWLGRKITRRPLPTTADEAAKHTGAAAAARSNGAAAKASPTTLQAETADAAPAGD
jgi:succinate dehydrogenase / fumarate reductase iron-sulfur subunit